MSGAGFNGNEALGSRVLMDVEALGECMISKGCSLLVHHSYANETTPEVVRRASMGLKPSTAAY